MADERPRILALDPGERRVGMAISDPLGITAQGMETFDRKTGNLLEHLAEVIDRYGVQHIVVGNPVSMSGRENESSKRAAALGEQLRTRFNIGVTLWDERLSSVEAKRVLAGTRASKASVDRIAAVLILQSYLDSRGA